MKPIDDFTNVLQSIAENKAITKDEIKKTSFIACEQNG